MAKTGKKSFKSVNVSNEIGKLFVSNMIEKQ